MIISRTPYRISFFGGGTDYPAWYRRYGGAVLGTTINKFCYVSVRTLPPFFDHRHRIVYSRIELPQTIEEIQHPAVRAVFQQQQIQTGVEVQHHGDLPARSGMGSSSAFTVGLLHSIRAYQGLTSSPECLAREAVRIEQDVIGENVGSQDQIWAAYGGTNIITFETDGSFKVTPVIIPDERCEELESHMLLFFTGLSRTAANIAKKQIENMDNAEMQLRLLQQMVGEASAILQDRRRSVNELGILLHDSWKLKKELADAVSNPAIDGIFAAALDAGAVGGKLLGAGGGGFILIIADPSKHSRIRARLKSLIEVSFKIGSSGSKIVVYEPDGLETLAKSVTSQSSRSL
ncbi:MAG TPA: kinase [Terriglobia bacterium]|nr:kinase [Terriglobia bacterium]